MRSANLSCLIFLVLLELVTSQGVPIPDRGCVSSFRNSSHLFDICRTNLCFVILPERPFVIPEPEVKSPPFHLFRCVDNDYYSGVFFDIMKKAGKSVPEVREAMCIYGGIRCSFDNSIRFIEDTAKLNAGYYFIAGGFFMFLPHRITEYTDYSQPWFSEKLVVLTQYEDEEVRHTFRSALSQIFQPFNTKGWNTILGFMCFFCIALGIHAYRFSHGKTCRELLRWFVLSRPSERREWEAASWNSLRLAVVVFFAISILLYEVTYISSAGPNNIRNIEKLGRLGLRNFAVVKGDASETIFRYAVGWDNRNATVPWVHVKTMDDAIGLVRNKTVKYAFSFEIIAATTMRRDELCDEIVAIPTMKKDFGGWYYGISIPRQLRKKIDKALATLVLEDLPRKSRIRFEMSPVNCGKMTDALDDRVLIFILSITVVPILLKHVASLILSSFWPNLEKPEVRTDTSLKIETGADPDEWIPEASESTASSSEFSQTSRVTKDNSSCGIDIKIH